jgi:ProP effector
MPRPPRPEGDRRHTANTLPPDRPRANSDLAMEPADPAQRERAVLLRTFESSSLSKANFCALKRISEAELDASLAQARAERDARRR